MGLRGLIGKLGHVSLKVPVGSFDAEASYQNGGRTTGRVGAPDPATSFRVPRTIDRGLAGARVQ